MSWYIFWIPDLLPLKEASGDSEDRPLEESTGEAYQLDDNDTASCCGAGVGGYNSDDESKTDCWFLSKEVLEHKGALYNEMPVKNEAVDEESKLQRLREDAKQFWEACIAHGY